MLKKTITYKDLDDNDVTEDFYFNLNKAELAEMALAGTSKGGGGFEEYLKKIIAANDGRQIMDMFKEIIAMSVGKRSATGKSFVKNPEIRDEFMGSEAYSILFMELVTDTSKAIEFIRNLVPADIAAQADLTGTFELPNSGVIEGVAGDAAVQAEKPQVQFEQAGGQPTPFPESLEAAVVANNAGNPQEDDEPAWMKETRYPTRQELMRMGPEETRLAMKMKSNRAFG